MSDKPLEFLDAPRERGGPRIRLNDGATIPLVGLGTYQLIGAHEVDEAVEAALVAGYRLFDTAATYFNEAQLGASLHNLLPKFGLRREDIFITTKLHPRTESMRSVEKRIEQSLSCLKTDYLDLVLIHYPCQRDLRPEFSSKPDDPENPRRRRETWQALEKIPRSKVRSIGVSNFEIRHLEELKSYATRLPAVNQQEFHPHFTRQELRQYSDQEGIFFQAFSSIGHHADELVGDPVVKELAKTHNTTPEVLLLAFATSQRIGVVPKSRSPDRIRLNFTCLDVKLNDEEIGRLLALNRNKFYVDTCQSWKVT